jgi:hypothetical protein
MWQFTFAQLLTSLAGLTLVHASETDAFSFRYTAIDDSTDIIDQEINRRMQVALKSIEKKGCEPKVLYSALSEQLRRPIYGKVEGWVKNHRDEIPHAMMAVQHSVYQDIKIGEAFPVYFGKIGFGPVLRVNGQLIGNDKLGHFLDEGYYYFETVQGKHQPKQKHQKQASTPNLSLEALLQQAIQYEMDTENGIFGLQQTGVHSYADTVANFNGLNFWSRILGQAAWEPWSVTSTSESPYVVCENDHYVMNHPFTLKDYVDAAWDEGINCNEYRNQRYKDRVFARIRMLEVIDPEHRPYACPVVPQACKEIAPKYGIYAQQLLHPDCLATTR